MLEIVENCPAMDFNFLFSNLNSTSAAVFAIFLFSCFLLRRSKKANRGQKLPEVAGGWPLIGHLHLLTGPEFPHIRLGALADKYGPIFNIKVGIHPTVVISSWEVAKEIFTTYDVAVSSRPKLAVGKYLGHNYIQFAFAPYGAYWREIRKITALELLSNRRLELLRHVRSSEVEGSIKELYKLWIKRRSEATHVLAEMKQWFGDLNLNVILRMVAGIRYSGAREAADEKEVRRCRKAMREWFHLAGLFVVRDAIPFLGWLDLGGYEKAMKRIAKELDSIVEKWLEEHRHRKKVEKGEQDFLDILLHVLESIDLSGFDVDTVIKATVIGLLTGATDTTTVTITWVLALLLNNLPALGQVQKELDVHVGKERLVMESDIHKLEYLQAVVKEALRLYPAGPLSGPREFSEDCIVGGYHVPKGTRLIVNLWKLQRDPRVWSDPLEFRPERFLTTHKDIDIKGQHFELLPFGGGRRLCPGVTFGLQMTQLALASLLQAFDISTPGNASVDMTESPGLTNIKATPLEIMVKPRLSLSLYDRLFEF